MLPWQYKDTFVTLLLKAFELHIFKLFFETIAMCGTCVAVKSLVTTTTEA